MREKRKKVREEHLHREKATRIFGGGGKDGGWGIGGV